jgi:hypothetical protein
LVAEVPMAVAYGARYDAGLDRWTEKAIHVGVCCLCGRPLTEKAARFQVFIDQGTNEVLELDSKNPSGSFDYIGPTCRKEFPSSLVQKFR